MRSRETRRTSRGIAPAADAIASWLGSQDLAQRLRPQMAWVHWAPVVGEQIAAVTQVKSVRDGVLSIRVKHSTWANEIDLLRDDIVSRLNLALGGKVITKLHIDAGGLEPARDPVHERERLVPTEEELALMPLSAEKLAWAERSVNGIQDPAWRERIYNTLLRVARADEWKRQHGWHPCPTCEALTPPDLSVCELCRLGIGSPSHS